MNGRQRVDQKPQQSSPQVNIITPDALDFVTFCLDPRARVSLLNSASIPSPMHPPHPPFMQSLYEINRALEAYVSEAVEFMATRTLDRGSCTIEEEDVDAWLATVGQLADLDAQEKACLEAAKRYREERGLGPSEPMAPRIPQPAAMPQGPRGAGPARLSKFGGEEMGVQPGLGHGGAPVGAQAQFRPPILHPKPPGPSGPSAQAEQQGAQQEGLQQHQEQHGQNQAPSVTGEAVTESAGGSTGFHDPWDLHTGESGNPQGQTEQEGQGAEFTEPRIEKEEKKEQEGRREEEEQEETEEPGEPGEHEQPEEEQEEGKEEEEEEAVPQTPQPAEELAEGSVGGPAEATTEGQEGREDETSKHSGELSPSPETEPP